MGFGGIIVHGVYAYSRVAHDLVQALGGSDPGNIKQFQAKFSGPVRLGDEIQTSLWRTGSKIDGWQEIRWVAKVVGTDRVCLSDGMAVIRTANSQIKGKL